jgi:uncharacterized membrane protein YjfL (UPF0719 family)
MSLSADAMRFILVACLIGIAALAILSLRRRKLSLLEFIGWGLLAVLVPLIGPFLVITSRPGKKATPMS